MITANRERLGKAAPYVRTIVDDLGFEVALPLLLSAHTLLSKTELEKVAKWLLVFVTRYTILLSLDPSGLENTLFALARDTRTQSADSRLSNIKNTLVRKAPNKQQIEAVKIDGDNLVLEPQDAVYILTRLANKMQSNTKEIALKEANLEHIYPKHPSTEWKNAEDLEPWLWHLGNLTMLGERLNTNVANAGFTKKRAYYEKTTELEMTKRLAEDYEEWDVAAIHKRAEQLLPLIVEVWDFNNPSRV